MRLKLVIVGAWLSCCGVCAGQLNWSSPVTVVTAEDLGVSQVMGAVMSASVDGRMAAVWQGHRTETAGIEPHIVPGRRHSNVFVSYSNGGQTWSAASLLSDPELVNAQGFVSHQPPNDFRFVWTSGDALSGFRLHRATTSDGGVSYTSSTVDREGSGQYQYVNPRIVVSGMNEVLVTYGVGLNRYNRSLKETYVSLKRSAIGDWTEVATGYHSYNFNQGPEGIFKGGVAVSGPDIMVSFESVFTPSRSYLMISRDSGLNWGRSSVVTTSGLAVASPYIATDGAGTWHRFGNTDSVQPGVLDQVYQQTSLNVGNTWSAPKRLFSNRFGVCSVATDGAGRWLALVAGEAGDPIKYASSEDDGSTWSDLLTIPGSRTSQGGETCVYAGGGRWAVAWSDESAVKVSGLVWGASGIGDWERLY